MNFDKEIDRYGTNSVKMDMKSTFGKPEDILPLWIADMDFKAPTCVIDALSRRLDHGVFGYSHIAKAYSDALESWFLRRFDWQTQAEWVVQTPGVVFALNSAVRAFTQPGDAIIIQQPVYYPFVKAVENNNRHLVVNHLVYTEGKYSVDYQEFERQIVNQNVKMFILCSPHNPVGRVWRKEELQKMGDICQKHGVIVLSDEIHCDFVRKGNKHYVFNNVDGSFADFSIVCTAPSKTFNLAGLQTSNIFIQNEALRKKFTAELKKQGFEGPNLMGTIACQAAYESGEQWLEELKVYLEENLSYVREFLEDNIPQIKMVESEGTYLAWLDCRELGLEGSALDDFMVHKAKLWLDDGPMFGAGGEGFQRVNLACRRATLEEAMRRLHTAVKAL